MTDKIMYKKIITGMAANFKSGSNTAQMPSKINWILFSFHFRFFNLSENIDIFEPKRQLNNNDKKDKN